LNNRARLNAEKVLFLKMRGFIRGWEMRISFMINKTRKPAENEIIIIKLKP